MAGIDHWVWNAYGLADTYFEGPENKEDLDHHGGLCFGLPASLNTSPVPAGDDTTERQIWTPREYFLIVFESRIRLQVLPEWEEISGRLEEAVENMVCDGDRVS